jgi:hypothetical protein
MVSRCAVRDHRPPVQKARAGLRTVVPAIPGRYSAAEAARRATCYRGSLGARNPALIQPFKRPFST